MKINKNKFIIILLSFFISMVSITASGDIEQSYLAKKRQLPDTQSSPKHEWRASVYKPPNHGNFALPITTCS